MSEETCQDVKTIVLQYAVREEREEGEECLLNPSESERMFPGVNHGKHPRFSVSVLVVYNSY